jgi:hypothetical protein
VLKQTGRTIRGMHRCWATFGRSNWRRGGDGERAKLEHITSWCTTGFPAAKLHGRRAQLNTTARFLVKFLVILTIDIGVIVVLITKRSHVVVKVHVRQVGLKRF